MRILTLMLTFGLVFTALAFGKDKPETPTAPKAGDKAPAFSLPAAGGSVSLKDFKGRWLALAFYPKAFAPRDKAQMASLRDAHARLAELNAAVVGISMDPLNVLEQFRKEEKLPFALACDAEKKVSTAYGALGLGGLFSTRMTVLIDPQGRVAAVINKVKEKSHGEQLVRVLTEAQAKPAAP